MSDATALDLPGRGASRTFGRMDEMPQRIDPSMDRAAAALLLGLPSG
ncbi:hypothetical protein [Streptomyces sp. TRM70350]|nr:hypothetical protein [Streptomyces sp. TRM70350]